MLRMVKCLRCGEESRVTDESAEQSVRCPACGKPVTLPPETDSSPGQNANPPQSPPRLMTPAQWAELDRLEMPSTEQAGEVPAPGAPLTVEELTAFVGPNAGSYLRQWKPALEGRTMGLGFNPAAFLLAGLWIPYRKMIKAALGFFGLLLAMNLVEMFVSPFVVLPFGLWIVAIISWFVCGIFGNRWYLGLARRVINQVRSRQLAHPDHLRALAKAGGTSLALSLGMFVLFLGVNVAVPFAVGSLFPGRVFAAPLTFNNGELYFVPPATRQDADKLGAYLVQSRFFDGQRKTVQLAKSGDRFEFRMIVVRDFDRNPQFLDAVRRFGRELSQNVFGGAVVDVHLCNEYLKTLKTVDGG